MRRLHRKNRNPVDAKRRIAVGAMALLAALWLPLASGPTAWAEGSSLQRMFEQVRRGFSGRSEPDSSTPQEDLQLRQPIGVSPREEQLPTGDAEVVWRTASGGEALPAPRLEGRVPLAGWDAPGNVELTPQKNGNISMVVRDASLSRVLSLLAQTYRLNIVASNDIDAIISITLSDVPLERALTSILAVANYTWVERDGIILITSLSDSALLPADVQGRRLEVFELDFASAGMIADAVTGLLSPIGKLAITESDPSDNRRTREMIVIEDLPDSLSRIAAYIHQVDQPPRQVLIEAHILQVTLKDTDTCGVDFDALLGTAGSMLTVKTTGFASTDASPAFLATVDAGDLNAVIELLQETEDTKTLGSPKLMVLNQQEARIQIGEKIAYSTTTTTQTSTTGGAAFIDTGVILTILPRITRDGRVLLHVAPEVSSAGERLADSDLPPDTATTELETDVMLRDGQGIVIGGLIKEIDSTKQTKVPYLGDVWVVGNVFKRSVVTKERVEIIVAILPRIQPYDCQWQNYEQGELARAATPLFDGPLCRTDRPWEPILPDGTRVAKPLIPPPPNKPYIDRSGDCVAPTPYYAVPRKPFVEQRFCDGCNEPAAGEEYAPAPVDAYYSEGTFPEGTVISDQP
jgi:hypothetical protein